MLTIINVESILGCVELTKIRDALVDLNPWWREPFSVEFKERAVYPQIQRFLLSKQIVALTGLRRVGKTTLLRKIVEDAIRGGFPAQNIVFFSFDEFREIELRSVLREFEAIFGKELGKEKVLVLLDEVQKLVDWENQLKFFYDLYAAKTKFVISGSESLFIRRKSKEPLAGRIFEFKVEPLSFKEFLLFKNAAFKPVALYEKELLRLFDEFVLTQGFPELVGVKEKEVIKKYLREGIVEKVIYHDIPRLFPVKDVSKLESLLTILMDEPGQLIELTGLAKELKISRQALSNYLLFLEDSFLIQKLYNYSKNARKTQRKLKKYYPAIVSPDLVFKDDDQSKSKVFEWLIVNQLNAEFFWRDSYKHEVDIIQINEKKIEPIEVKYGKIETNGLLAFLKKFGLPKGTILSYKRQEEQKIENKKIFILPAYRFLLEQEKRN